MTELFEPREWGHTCYIRGPRYLEDDVIDAVKSTLVRHHRISRQHDPSIPELGEYWFRVGPVEQAIEYDDCTVLHETREHPKDCHGGCSGTGLVNPRPIEGKFDHYFGWYVAEYASAASGAYVSSP